VIFAVTMAVVLLMLRFIPDDEPRPLPAPLRKPDE
jgi:hypothetical protein